MKKEQKNREFKRILRAKNGELALFTLSHSSSIIVSTMLKNGKKATAVIPLGDFCQDVTRACIFWHSKRECLITIKCQQKDKKRGKKLFFSKESLEFFLSLARSHIKNPETYGLSLH